MPPDAFRPLETTLPRDETLAILRATLAGADDGELFLERRKSGSLVLDDRRPVNASYNASEGFGLRAVHGEVTGYAHSTDMTIPALNRAAETARLAVGHGGGTWAAPPLSNSRKRYSDENPVSGQAFAAKIETLHEIDDFVRGLDPRVVQVTASLAAHFQEILILRADGAEVSDTRPMTRLNITVIVEENGRRESGSAGCGGRVGLSGILERSEWQKNAREALRIACVNLQAVPAPAGIMDVVLGPGWPGILLHEAIGHGLEGDFNRKGTSAFAGLMGKPVAAPGVTVLDDGTIPDRRGSISVDDEGTPSERTTLIEDGVLVGYMQDRQNARLMGAKSTGNGRRQSYAHAPMPRMTNTCMLGGDASPEGLVADMQDGIWAVGFGGGQVDITNGKFVFSCTEAYRVRSGKLCEPVKGATLIGDGPTALHQIRGLGNDMALDPGMGTCGKAGQWVPVGVGQPSTLIGGLTVGGSAT